MPSFTVQIEIDIRRAQASDLEHLARWLGFDTRTHREALRYYLAEQQRGGGVLVVADAGGAPIGQLFLCLRRGDPDLADGKTTACITALRVWVPFRRHGVATRLVRVAEEMARQRGFSMMTIGTDVDNDDAHRLYLSWGYKDFKRGTYEWDDKLLPQICLRKRIGPGPRGEGPA